MGVGNHVTAMTLNQVFKNHVTAMTFESSFHKLCQCRQVIHSWETLIFFRASS